MLIKVRVEAGATHEAVRELAPDRFEIAVRQPAAENRANKQVIALIAARFAVARSAVRIIKGHHSPAKILSIARN